ncbi:MAG: AAA family ATPase [Crocinitomicaceae bacterium]|nr:AAA family ATPase [Crocinitomicaceae bacterium]
MSSLLSQQHFEKQLHYYFSFPPTKGQQRLFHAFTRFTFSSKPRCAMMVKGYAGTGKTTCVSAMVKALLEAGFHVVLLAPTGRAAKVLGNYSKHPAWTIHKQIYLRRSDRSGNAWFELKENIMVNTVFFVDEASMIGTERFIRLNDDIATGDLLEDLITHIYSGEGCRMVLIGDGAQLPPVGSDQSPALKTEFLRREYSLNIAELELNEVIRQKEGSGILENATILRELILEEKNTFPVFNISEFSDIKALRTDMQPFVEDAFSKYGVDDTIIITRSNKRANIFNQQVRARILGHEEEINSSDRMIVLKNNYFWLESQAAFSAGFIANGDTIQIKRVRSFEDRGPFRFCKAVIHLVDYPDLPEMEVLLLCNSIWEESPAMGWEKIRELGNLIAQDYPDIKNLGQLRKKVQEDPYYNALQVKFAYAVTCHKSQGGQWLCVFVDQGYVTDEMAGKELNRWMYTAFTRAQKELFLVGFDERMIGEENV